MADMGSLDTCSQSARQVAQYRSRIDYKAIALADVSSCLV